MSVQKFYLPDGRSYVEYGVEDVEHDYANVVIAPIDEMHVIGLGYVLREEVTLGIELETDVATITKRWFAYDAGAYGGVPGTRVGNVNAGYATMEGAIRGLLREYVDVPGVVKTDASEVDERDSSTYGYYDQEPIMIDPWADTDADGYLGHAVTEAIGEAGNIHVMTSSLMCDIVSEVSKYLWRYRNIFDGDHVGIRMHVDVDTPYDAISGMKVIDDNRPFEGMSLHIDTVPARNSIIPEASVSISVVDVENAMDASVLVGTVIVNKNEFPSYGDSGDGLDVGLSVESFASEAKTRQDEEIFASRIMLTFMAVLMHLMLTEYQSMVPSDADFDDLVTPFPIGE